MGAFQGRGGLVVQGVPVLGATAIAAFNGTFFSPIFDSIFYYLDTFARGTPFYSQQLYLNLTSAFIAVMTLLIAGIPAALYERMRGLEASTPVSLGIWLLATVLLTLPTILRAFGDEYGG
jgi:hypothetical protein